MENGNHAPLIRRMFLFALCYNEIPSYFGDEMLSKAGVTMLVCNFYRETQLGRL